MHWLILPLAGVFLTPFALVIIEEALESRAARHAERRHQERRAELEAGTPLHRLDYHVPDAYRLYGTQADWAPFLADAESHGYKAIPYSLSEPHLDSFVAWRLGYHLDCVQIQPKNPPPGGWPVDGFPTMHLTTMLIEAMGDGLWEGIDGAIARYEQDRTSHETPETPATPT